MTTKLHVCKSSSCKSLGSDKLIRDLEELCADSSSCQAVNGHCLDHCGRGPNVQVESRSGSKVIEGVKTFKDIRNLLEKTAGAKIKKLDFTVAEIKYEARRAKGPDRLAKVEKGFKAIGGEDKASKEPRLAASLLAFRAEEALRNGGDLEAALKDAQGAYALWKGFAPAHAASALALFRLGKPEEAKQEMLRLEDAPFGTPAAEDRRALMKEAEKVKEAEKAKEAEKTKEAQKAMEAEKEKQEQKLREAVKPATVEAAPKPAAAKPAAAAQKAKPQVKTKPNPAPKAASTSLRPAPAPLADEEDGSNSNSLPMTRVHTYLSTVPDEGMDRSPGGGSSTKETGFQMMPSDLDSEMEKDRPLVYMAEPRSAALERRHIHPKGRRWIVSL